MTEMVQSVESQIQALVGARMQEFSRIKEVVSGWSGVRQYLRGGDAGKSVPVVIPKDGRRYGWLFLLGVAVYLLGFAIFSGSAVLAVLAGLVAIFFLALALLWRGAIEQGTMGVRSRYGRIEGTLSPGRHYLWRPWDRVEFVVDTATEIPYLVPVAVCPTRENVPLKAIEFFPEVPYRGPARVRVCDRGLQLRPRPFERRAGRHKAAQSPGEHGRKPTPCATATWATCRIT